ncbi:Lhr family helicase [Corynebacterium bovis]|uniref:Lhr family helicase n=1 Tax=Corynebacterium bovis TaxID=36808 RepID=UPI00313A4C46
MVTRAPAPGDSSHGDPAGDPADDPLDLFHPPVAAWFREVFTEPTAVQRAAWRAVAAGEHTLVVAPTGSGKTLAAFLWALSRLSSGGFLQHTDGGDDPGPGAGAGAGRGTTPRSGRSGRTPGSGTRVLYISPLKALGVDVDRNLAVPLAGIARTAEATGDDVAPVRVGVRSGDTPAAERARLLRTPPEILITTPESLYLLLTSKAAGTLRDVDTVIVDEIHAVAGTKRGSHLALSLERLEAVTGAPVQRIGLSATVNPVDTVAAFLGGDRPVTVVNPPAHKAWDVHVRSVVEDFRDPPGIDGGGDGEGAGDGAGDGDPPVDDALVGPTLIGEGVGGATPPGSGRRVASGVDRESALPTQRSVWPHVQRAVYGRITRHRSTLVFVNARRTAERLTGALNEMWAEEHDPDALAAPTRRNPAQVMAQSARVPGAPAVIARAHHGSVSKDERADIEAALKSGELRCVVATSSLELGIDMGLVDHVIQVGAPPSVSAAVQRFGRAGHTVGAVSSGTVYPLHRQDAEIATVVVDRMLAGDLEPVEVVTNALDVLAQQTVAVTAQAAVVAGLDGDDGDGARAGTVAVEDWFRRVRRAHPYAALPREAFDGVVDLVSGRYPSTDFAGLRPRVVYDPVAGTLEARPGAQRLAVTSGGTIPDRGMFGVFLATGDDGGTGGAGGTGGRRVGELDEEMVYESRVGDVFTLGASSWRITDITRDRVVVVPAAGHTGRLPFWTGDGEGRPAGLAAVIGRCRRAWGRGGDGDLRDAPFLDDNTRANLDSFYASQRETTGTVPDDRTLLVERFRDEVGDWRVVVHSPYGRGVNAPWALALGVELERRSGIDAMPVAGDDGIVLRLPYTEEPPGVELLTGVGDDAGVPADLVLGDVTGAVGGAALFAARFRECAARSLLLPRRSPGARQPLWQQRQRAAQLLDVARQHPEFPVMVETMRECLHDVYDLDALARLVTAAAGAAGGAAGGRVRVAEVTTDTPGEFARSLLFSYTGAFMYEGDSAERSAALAVDPALLAAVLGRSGGGLVLDADVVADTVAALQWLADGRRARSAEQVVDMLRELGPLTPEEVERRCDGDAAARAATLDAVRAMIPRRVCAVRVGGTGRLAVVEDAPLLRDGLGVPVPPGVAADTGTVRDAVDQLLLRWARGRGPFTAAEAAAEFGLGVATAGAVLRRWVQGRRLESGVFEVGGDTGGAGDGPGEGTTRFVDVAVLRRLRAATLARARGALDPVSPQTYAEFVASWHGLGQCTRDELPGVLEQLAGCALPASAWETVVLPARIPDVRPADLDDLLATGEVLAVGAGTAGTDDPLVMLLPADLAPVLLPEPGEGTAVGPLAAAVHGHLRGGGAFLAAEVTRALGADADHAAVDDALWELFDAGLVTPDSFAPLRARLAGVGRPGSGTRAGSAHRAPRRGRDRGRGAGRLRMGRTTFAQTVRSEEVRARREAMNAHAGAPGRWSAAPEPSTSAADRAVAQGEAWLDRYGVVTRGSIVAEHAEGGFAQVYRTLSAWEDSGSVLRGYVVDGLGGAQFASRGVTDQLRRTEDSRSGGGTPPVLLAAADPANPFGAALPWPASGSTPTRGAGALVVLSRGRCLAHLTRGGRTVTVFGPPSFDDAAPGDDAVPAEDVATVVGVLADAVRAGRVSPVTVERLNGRDVMEADTRAWVAAGARLTPKGLSVRG